VKLLFADTFYWVALYNPRDAARQKVLEFSRQQSGTLIVTTDEVLTEFLNFFGVDSQARIRAAKTVQSILDVADTRVIPQTRASFLAGLELYQARPDKGYSLTDCISMQTMRRENIVEALTNDRHFQQEGFKALFKD
jgi:predicted nucleic acid-binding protein